MKVKSDKYKSDTGSVRGSSAVRSSRHYSQSGSYRAQLAWSFLVAIIMAVVVLQQSIGPKGGFRSTASTPQSVMTGNPILPGGNSMAGSIPPADSTN